MHHLFCFLVALTSVLAVTNARPKPILDTNGRDLMPGSAYYVVPYRWNHNRGGGLRVASDGNEQCPLDVVQAPSMDDDGLPVKFSNWGSGFDFVPQSEDLNIQMAFADMLACADSDYWRVDYGSGRVILGSKPEGDFKDKDGFFQIQKSDYHDYHYKFSFCPGFFARIRKLSWPSFGCIDVGIEQDRYGVRRLALNEGDYWVTFKKANGTEVLSKPMPM